MLVSKIGCDFYQGLENLWRNYSLKIYHEQNRFTFLTVVNESVLLVNPCYLDYSMDVAVGLGVKLEFETHFDVEEVFFNQTIARSVKFFLGFYIMRHILVIRLM